jgi:hypothetical protein
MGAHVKGPIHGAVLRYVWLGFKGLEFTTISITPTCFKGKVASTRFGASLSTLTCFLRCLNLRHIYHAFASATFTIAAHELRESHIYRDPFQTLQPNQGILKRNLVAVACKLRILANHMAVFAAVAGSSGRMTHEFSPNLNKPELHVTFIRDITTSTPTLRAQTWTLPFLP